MQRMLAAWLRRFADPYLPRTLAGQLRAGVRVDHIEVLALLNPEYDPDAYSVANSEIMADFVVAQGGLTREAADAWLADLRQLGRHRRYFFSLNRYLLLASR